MNDCLWLFIAHFLISIQVVYLPRYLVVAWLVQYVPRETAALSAQALCTPFNHAPCSVTPCKETTRRVHVCLAVTCHLHFWQNDRHLSRTTAITRGWNGYRNKSQHGKLTLEKKIHPSLCRDSNPRPFDHERGALRLSYPRSII